MYFENRYYKTEEEYLFALAAAMREEYKAVVDAGFVLQVDDPRLITHYNRVPGLSLEENRKFIELRVEVLNHALEDIPEDRVRFHTCYSINVAPRVHDLEVKEMIACFEADWEQKKFAPDGTFLLDWGNFGGYYDEFNAPTGIATDDFGNVYVSDSYNHRVQRFSAEDGTWLSSWGYQGPDLGEFDTPSGIATDPSGSTFVSDTYNKRIEVLGVCCGLDLYGRWRPVRKGHRITLKGRMLATVPECYTGSTIRLVHKQSDVATATTNDKGVFSFSLKLRQSSRFKAVFDGKPYSQGTCDPTESYSIYVGVRAPVITLASTSSSDPMASSPPPSVQAALRF
jgi:hypothetical protein